MIEAMNMSTIRQWLVSSMLALCVFAQASATVGNPDHTLYGAVSIFGQPAPEGTLVELRSARDGAVLASYRLGGDPRLDGRFALRIPMDDAGGRVEGRSRPGDPVRAFVAGRLAAETTVGAEGEAVELVLDPGNMGNIPTLDVPNVSMFEGQSGSSALNFTASLSEAGDEAVTLHWATAENDSAIGGVTCSPGVDYRNASGDVTIPVGATTATFAVLVCGDTQVEADETFVVEISGVANALAARSQIVATIVDDEDAPELSIDDASAAEPSAGSAPLAFTARLSHTAALPVSFAWNTSELTATADVDYVEASGTATIPAGQLSTTISVALLADAEIEPEEQFALQLGAPANALLADSEAIGTIRAPGSGPALEPEDTVRGGPGGISALLQPVAIALDPDGRHAYVLARGSDAVLQFARGLDGRLAFMRAYDAQSAGFDLALLDGVSDLRISADGTRLFVAAEDSHAITLLARDPINGDLTFVSSLREGDPDVAKNVAAGLQYASALALSPDDAFLYVASRRGDSLAAYAISPEGRLSFVEVERHGINDPTDPGPSVTQMDGPSGLVVSPDGAQVYVSAQVSGALAVFARGADGKLSFVRAHVDGAAGVDGLGGASSLVLGPGGAQLYATGANDNALARFARGGDGALTFQAQMRSGESNLTGLSGARASAVAPDGRQLFATGYADHSLVVFDRDADGALSHAQTVFDGQEGAASLAGPVALAASGDDLHLYVVAEQGNAIVQFRRPATVLAEYTLTYASGLHGRIAGQVLQTVPPDGDGSAVLAVPDVGYAFLRWSDDRTDNPRIDTQLQSNLHVTAVFATARHTLRYAAGEHGQVQGNAEQQVLYGGSGTPVLAVPDPHFAFQQWSDGRTDNPRTDTVVTADLDVAAEFVRVDPEVALSISIDNEREISLEGDEVLYRIDVRNDSGIAVPGVAVGAILPDALLGAAWECSAAEPGICAPPEGMGDVAVLLDLPPQSVATILLTAKIGAFDGMLHVTATLTVPDGYDDTDPDDDSDTDSDSVGGLFRDGFEGAVPE